MVSLHLVPTPLEAMLFKSNAVNLSALTTRFQPAEAMSLKSKDVIIAFWVTIKKNISYLQVTGEEVYKSLSTYPHGLVGVVDEPNLKQKLRNFCCLYTNKNRAIF